MILSQRPSHSAFKDLLESETINIEKFKQHVQKNSVLAELKPLYWKILLGIKSPYRDIRQYVDQANCDIYKRLHSTLTTCGIIQSSTPISQQFLSMYLLDSHAMKLPITSTVSFLEKFGEGMFGHMDEFRKSMNRLYPLEISSAHFWIMIMNNDWIPMLNVG